MQTAAALGVLLPALMTLPEGLPHSTCVQLCALTQQLPGEVQRYISDIIYRLCVGLGYTCAEEDVNALGGWPAGCVHVHTAESALRTVVCLTVRVRTMFAQAKC